MRARSLHSRAFCATVVCLLALCLAGCSTRSPEEYLKSGIEYSKKKDYARARIEFLNAVKKRPGYVDAHYQMGLSSLALNDYPTAFRALSKAEQLDDRQTEGKSPISIDIRLKLAQVMLYARDYVGARFKSQWVLHRQPGNRDALAVLAFALAKTAQPEQALQYLDILLQADPRNLQARALRASIRLAEHEFESARKDLDDSLVQTNRSAEALLAMGNLYLISGKPRDAEPYYREAATKDAKSAGPRLALGWMYARLAQPQEAEQVFRQLGRDFPGDATARMALANYYLYLRDWPRTITELQRLGTDPKDRPNRRLLAAVYMFAGRNAEARAVLDKLISEDADDAEAIVTRGVLYVGEGRAKDAIEQFSHALKLYDGAVMHFYLAVAHYQQRANVRAQEELQNALRRDPYLLQARIWLAQLLMRPDRDTDAADKGPQAAMDVLLDAPLAQQQLPVVRLTRALSYFSARKEREAADEVRAVLSEDPQFIGTFYQMGFGPMLERYAEMTEKALETGLRKEPDSPEMLAALLRLYVTRNKREQAIARAQEQVRQLPRSAIYRVLLADTLRSFGRRDEARAEYQQAVAIDANLPTALLGLAQNEFEAGNLQDAARHFQTALERWPEWSLAWSWLGVVREAQNNRVEAIRCYEKALDRNSPVAANNLARLLSTDSRNLSRAFALAEAARELQPWNPVFADTFGWIYYKMGSPVFARSELIDAVSRDPRNPLYNYHLGVVNFELGRYKDAVDNLQLALKTNPSMPEAEDAQRRLETAEERLARRER